MEEMESKHLWIVYPLVGLAVVAVVVALLLPLFQWVFSAAGFVSVLLAMGTAKEYGLIRGKGWGLAWMLLFLFGASCFHGFNQEFARQALRQAVLSPPLLAAPLAPVALPAQEPNPQPTFVLMLGHTYEAK